MQHLVLKQLSKKLPKLLILTFRRFSIFSVVRTFEKQHVQQLLQAVRTSFSSFPKAPVLHLDVSSAFIRFGDYVPFRLESKILYVGITDKLLVKPQSPWH